MKTLRWTLGVLLLLSIGYSTGAVMANHIIRKPFEPINTHQIMRDNLVRADAQIADAVDEPDGRLVGRALVQVSGNLAEAEKRAQQLATECRVWTYPSSDALRYRVLSLSEAVRSLEWAHLSGTAVAPQELQTLRGALGRLLQELPDQDVRDLRQLSGHLQGVAEQDPSLVPLIRKLTQ